MTYTRPVWAGQKQSLSATNNFQSNDFCLRRLTHSLCNPPNSSLHRHRHHRHRYHHHHHHHHLGEDYSSFFNLSCFKHFFFSGLLYLKIGQANRNTIDFGSKIL
ncbi:hypothetical protein L1987_49136 [Smallanthus sonchifolius]|uniref:Uncharacterized protein n=1 Tax=Smallanthus sonchifolius TaxID=185202 RepID=A0ACB9FTX7_9ASTR|nr:hypothetical protein L1987_49136 [Smallanthus sonchifolius]